MENRSVKMKFEADPEVSGNGYPLTPTPYLSHRGLHPHLP
jgi:hypothetical protein